MKKNSCKKILFITLSNIGDAVLTTPVLGLLVKELPNAEITVMASNQSAELFLGNPALREVIIWRKSRGLKEKINLVLELRRRKFDMVIDLKNTFLSPFLNAKYKTPLRRKIGERIYKKDVFLNLLKDVFEKSFKADLGIKDVPFYIWISDEDKQAAENLLKECFGSEQEKFITISPFAKSDTKTWPIDNFAKVIQRFNEDTKYKIILVGAESDREKCEELARSSAVELYNLCGKTNLKMLAWILKKSSCLVSNDSAAMHIAAAMDVPVTAIFGPTDDKKYAPPAKIHRIITAPLNCRPCEKAQCVFGKKPADCLNNITVDEVVEKIEEILR
ncbi:MAG: lipopolysaccharide heptosyltransferase II [Candidatus Omnitrophota bacterium]